MCTEPPRNFIPRSGRFPRNPRLTIHAELAIVECHVYVFPPHCFEETPMNV
jgi:hypothetical protein